MIEILDYKDKTSRRVIKDLVDMYHDVFAKPSIIRIVIIYDKNFHFSVHFTRY